LGRFSGDRFSSCILAGTAVGRGIGRLGPQLLQCIDGSNGFSRLVVRGAASVKAFNKSANRLIVEQFGRAVSYWGDPHRAISPMPAAGPKPHSGSSDPIRSCGVMVHGQILATRLAVAVEPCSLLVIKATMK
jgi:hypothetical protein